MATFREEIVIGAKDEASTAVRSAMLSIEGLREVQQRASQAFMAGIDAITGWVQEALAAETAYTGLESALQQNIASQQTAIGLYGESTVMLGMNSEAVTADAMALKELAYELQNHSAYAGDNIVQMQAALAQYGLNTAQIQEMTPALIDMASAYEMATGKQISLTDVAKRYNDATQGSKEALKDFGINLKDVQGNMIPYEILVGKITEATQGQAEVFAGTATGAIRSMANAWGDLERDLGQAVLPLLMNLMNGYIKPLITWVGSLSTETKQAAAVAVLFGTALAGLTAAAATLSIAVNALNFSMVPWIATFAAVAAGAYALYEALSYVLEVIEQLSGYGLDDLFGVILSGVGADQGASIDEAYSRGGGNKPVYEGFNELMNENESSGLDTPIEEGV